ncbi:hypothetical protein MCOR25_008201 [Pyricularia grisea]|nr:hypothetical protein MCOR25_008201 [Pyricularia grisea]
MSPPTPAQSAVESTIRRRKCAYIHWVDLGPYTEVPSCLMPDIQVTFLNRDGTVMGQDTDFLWQWNTAESYAAFLVKGMTGREGIHMADYGTFTHVSDDEVKVIFGVTWDLGPPAIPNGEKSWCGGGHYHETWKRVPKGEDGEEWFMSELKMQVAYQRFFD